MSDEFAFEKAHRNGSTVDLQQRCLVATARRGNGAGNQVFASTGVTKDQHRRIAGRHSKNLIEHLLEWCAVANNFVEVAVRQRISFQITSFLVQSFLQLL